jgi:DNA-directed RNA polymerase subunit L
MSQQTIVQNLELQSNDINLAKTQYAGLKDLIPDSVNQRLSFELIGSNYAIANGLRRTITNEIPVKYLTVSMTDIFSTDPYVVGDIIRSRIEMIPISQNIPLGTTYSIRFENKSDTYVDVLSSEIKQRKSNSSGLIQSIPICSINANHSFVVENIVVAEAYGYSNGRASIGKISYEILNHDMKNISSANSDPSHFRIELEVPGNINPKKIVLLAIDTLIDRLNTINYALAKLEYGVYKLLILNETHTIGNLLVRYIYNIDPNIEYVAMRLTHPSKRECVIDIRHAQAEKLCKRAVENITKELSEMKKFY